MPVEAWACGGNTEPLPCKNGHTLDANYFAVIPACLHGKAARRVRLDLLEALGHFIQIVGDRHDLTVRDPHKMAGVRRLRVAPSIFI